MVLYGLKNCDTCRKALKALENVELVDVSLTPVDADVLARAFEQFGDALVNTRSTTWRGLDDGERELEPLELLSRHPKLMKRPLIASGNKMYLGWTAETQNALGVEK